MTSKLKSHIIIGLAGRRSSGKSTIINQLELILIGHEFFVEIIHMASTIKEQVAEAIGGSTEIIDRLKSTNNLTRWILEKVGCEYFKPEDLCTCVNKQIKETSIPSIILLDSVCRITEEQFIHNELKGIIIGIERPLYDEKKNIISSPELLPSELELNKLHYDYWFQNDSTSLVRLRTDLRQLIFGEVFNRSDVKEKMV